MEKVWKMMCFAIEKCRCLNSCFWIRSANWVWSIVVDISDLQKRNQFISNTSSFEYPFSVGPYIMLNLSFVESEGMSFLSFAVPET